MKKGIIILFLLAFTMMFSTTIALAEEGVLSKIKTESTDIALKNKIDTAANKLITTVRSISIVVCVLIAAWIFYSLWFSANPQGLMQMKVRVAFFVVGLYGGLFTESIVGFVLNFMGYTIN